MGYTPDYCPELVAAGLQYGHTGPADGDALAPEGFSGRRPDDTAGHADRTRSCRTRLLDLAEFPHPGFQLLGLAGSSLCAASMFSEITLSEAESAGAFCVWGAGTVFYRIKSGAINIGFKPKIITREGIT